MSDTTRAVLTAAVAAVVAVVGYLGWLPVALAAGALVLVVAVGWPVLLELPTRLGTSVVIGLTGVGAVVTVAATPDAPLLRGLPVVVAGAVLAAFLNELLRQDGRLRLVESVTGTVTGVLVVTAAAGWVGAVRSGGGASLVVAGAVALAVAAAVSASPGGTWVRAVGTTVAAVVAGAAVSTVLPAVDPVAGGVLGLATGVLVAAVHGLLHRSTAFVRRSAATTAVVLPVAVSGIVVYGVGRVLVA